MTQTVSSGEDAYLTAAEFLARVDERVVGQWLSDTGTALTEAQMLASAKLAQALKGASGELESACLIGERYSADDLAALADSDTNSAALLKDVVAGLSLARVWQRRPRTNNDPYPTQAQWSQQLSEQLRNGVRIFGLAESAEAGRMDVSTITPEEVAARRLISTSARRFFGRRAINERPNDDGSSWP